MRFLLNESSGLITNDTSGLGNNATLQGTGGQIGQRFPGKCIRIGSLNYLNANNEPFINCFDLENESPKPSINNITFFKMVGIHYFSIYTNINTDKEKEHYLQIHNYVKDIVVKLFYPPVDIFVSKGQGYAAIYFEEPTPHTEIWNILGKCIDNINGLVSWKE